MLKFVLIADTHGKHRALELPAGDVLIHAGDVSMKGEEKEITDFLQWFSKQDFAYKILVAGNHDFYFEKRSEEEIAAAMPDGIIYLKDSGTIINDLHIWGSPVTPWFFGWAFNRHRGDVISRHWDLIPPNTDILITHGPPFRVLDKNYREQHVGCKDLFLAVEQIKPQLHVFGHIHESYGMVEKSGTKFINASILNEKFELQNIPFVVDI